jgi:hypothetical protein
VEGRKRDVDSDSNRETGRERRRTTEETPNAPLEDSNESSPPRLPTPAALNLPPRRTHGPGS